MLELPIYLALPMKLKLLWGKALSYISKDEQLVPESSAQTNSGSINCTSSLQVPPISYTQDPLTPRQSSTSSDLALTWRQKLKGKSNRTVSHEPRQKELVRTSIMHPNKDKGTKNFETIQKLLQRQNSQPPNSTALDIGLDLYQLEDLSRQPVSVDEMQCKLNYLGDVIRLMSEYLTSSNTGTFALMPRLAAALFDACSSCSHWGWAERYFYGMMKLVDISMVEVEYRDDVPIYHINPYPYNVPETATLVTLTCYLGCQMARYHKSEDFLMKEIFVIRIIPCLVYLCNFQQEITDSPGIALMYIFFRLDVSLAEIVDINSHADFSRYNRIPLRLRRLPGDEVPPKRPDNHMRLHFPPVRVFRISIETFIPQGDPNFKDKFQTELLNSPVFLSSESENHTIGSGTNNNQPDLESNFSSSPLQNAPAINNNNDSTVLESIWAELQPPVQPNLNFDTYDYSVLDQINFSNSQDARWENHIRGIRSRGANNMSQTPQPLGSDFTNGSQFHNDRGYDSITNGLNNLPDPLYHCIAGDSHGIPLRPRDRDGQDSPPKFRYSSTNDQGSKKDDENLRETCITAHANHDVSKEQQKAKSDALLLILTQSEYQPPTYLTRTLMPFWIRCAVLGYFRRRGSNMLIRSDQSFEPYINALLQWGYSTEADESIKGIYRALFNLAANHKYAKNGVGYMFIWTNYYYFSSVIFGWR